MDIEREISLVERTFQKLNINTMILNINDRENMRGIGVFDGGLRGILGVLEDFYNAFFEIFSQCKKNAVYSFTDRFMCTYTYMLLDRDRVFFIGPYVASDFKSSEIAVRLKEMNVSTKTVRACREYYSLLPRLDEKSKFFLLIESLCDILWGEGNYSFYSSSDESEIALSTAVYNNIPEDKDENTPKEKLLEIRYGFENEFMRAISRGESHKIRMVSAFSQSALEHRTDDTVRNLKNYCIIMNTLSRKAAENGGVHPIYLDSVSRNFAIRIENSFSVRSVKELVSEMFVTYCNLVKRYSVKGYSEPIKEAVTLISSNISSPLRLSDIAEKLKLSPSYLSDLFKRETGVTVTEYVNRKKMDYSAHLLTTTGEQVQDIAALTGIVDVQYFSKLFKKIKGETPLEYRKKRIAKSKNGN